MFKGRWKNKQYNPSKPSKYIIKTFGLCDSATGYAFNILTFFGSDTSYNSDTYGMEQSEKNVEYLLNPLGKGHHIFADRYYTTHSLISYLPSKSCHYTGTLQTNRKNFSDSIKFQKDCRVKYLQTNYYCSESGILVVQWQDKKAKNPVVAVYTKFAKNVVQYFLVAKESGKYFTGTGKLFTDTIYQ